jgi:Putative adhesin
MATYLRTQTIEHEIGERGRFELKVASSDTQLRGVPGGEVRLQATFEIRAATDAEAEELFEGIQLLVDRGAGWLRVEAQEQRAGSSIGAAISRLLGGPADFDLTIHAELPSSAEVRFEGVSADVQASGLVGEQRYETVSGDLFLTDAAGSARIDSVSGDVTLRGTDSLEMRADTVSGDLSVSAPRIAGLLANAVSGDVEIEGELAPAGDFRVETVSGDLTVGLLGSATFEVRGLSSDISSEIDHRLEGHVDRRRLVFGSGKPELLFNSMSGDLAVRRPRRVVSTPAEAAEPVAPQRGLSADEELAVLQALERGEIDVDEAARRLGGED